MPESRNACEFALLRVVVQDSADSRQPLTASAADAMANSITSDSASNGAFKSDAVLPIAMAIAATAVANMAALTL